MKGLLKSVVRGQWSVVRALLCVLCGLGDLCVTAQEKPLIVFDTIADLVARGNPKSRDVVLVLGWTNAFDGFATTFKSTNSVTGTNTTTRIYSGVAGWSWDKAFAAGGSLQTSLDGVSTNQGSVLFKGATLWTNLLPGTSGHFLMSQGTGADPVWAEAPGASAGEANLGANLGTGYPIFQDKSSVTLRFNSITNGAGVTISSNANVFAFSVSDPLTPADATQNITGSVDVAGPLFSVTRGHQNFVVVDAPATAPSVATGSAGALTGTYNYAVSFVTTLGETEPGTVSATVTPSSQRVELTNIPVSGDAAVAARNVYRNTNGWLFAFPFTESMQLVTTINDNTTTVFSDNVADTSLGAFSNWRNGTGGELKINGVAAIEAGDSTTAFGRNTLTQNQGAENTVFGANALKSNTFGWFNTVMGRGAMEFNTIGRYSTAFGQGALRKNVSSHSNTAFGVSALYEHLVGEYNTGLGVDALQFLITGSDNLAVGKRAAWQVTNTSGLTIIGTDALFTATGQNMDNTTAVGTQSLYNAATNNNQAFGAFSLWSLTTGTENATVGRATLYNITTNNNNVAVGNNSGRYSGDGSTALTSADRSIFLGANSQGSNGAVNQIVIGYGATNHLGDNAVILGSTDVSKTQLRGEVGIGVSPASGVALQVGGDAVLSGSVTATNGLVSGSSVSVAAASPLIFTGRTRITSQTDGELTLLGSNNTTFASLNFGLSDATGLRFRQSGDQFLVRQGDESGPGDILVGQVLADHVVVGNASANSLAGLNAGSAITNVNLSGAVTTSGGLATSISPDAVALGTDTTGNYAAGDGEAGAALTGDSATGFFGTGAIEIARGGTGQGTAEAGFNALGGGNATLSGTNLAVTGGVTAHSGTFTNSLTVGGTAVSVAGHAHAGEDITSGTVADGRIASSIARLASPTFTGTVTVPDNSFALGTKTTGNYAAGDGEAGAALTGDSALGFFGAGELEIARGGTGQATAEAGFNALGGGNATLSGTNLAVKGVVTAHSGAFTNSLTVGGTAVSLSGHTHAASTITFSDPDGIYAATDIEGAVVELAAVNGGGVNSGVGKVDWTQLEGVPAGFADGTDDGPGGSGDEVFINGAAIANPDFDDSAKLVWSVTGTNVTGFPTNLVNADISASAAIARSKIAAGTASHAVVNDGSGNLSSVAVTGSGNVMRTRTGVYREVWIDAGAMIPYSTNAATAGQHSLGSGNGQADVWSFDDTTPEYVGFTFAIPDSWGLGSVKFKVAWTTAAASGNVQWTVGVSAIANDEALSISSWQGFASVDQTDTVTSANDLHVTAATGGLTVLGPSLRAAALGDIHFFSVSRDTSTSGDLTGDAKLLGVWAQYQESTTESSGW